MKNHRESLLVSVLILLVFVSLTDALSTTADIGKFRQTTCPFPLPQGLILGDNFLFGYVNVPELHSRPDGKIIELAVAIFPSSGKNRKPDPVVMNTSGPGKSNLDNFIPQIAAGLGNHILPHRDIVIIELRGLRYSKPFLMCSEIREARMSMMDKHLTTTETMNDLKEALLEAKHRFEKEGVNLSAFNNVETAADIAMIMSGMGYDQFNMVGSSAGTLVAHHVMRDYPERVRCSILDAGLPIDSTVFRDMVPNVIAMLKRYFSECDNDPRCKSAYPDLEDRFLGRIDSLNQNPVSLPVQDPVTGEEREYVLNGYRLSGFIALSMYFNTQIPYLINTIIEGDYRDIQQSVSNGLIPNYFADGLGITIQQSEAKDYTLADIEIDPKYKTFAEGLTRDGLGGEYLLEAGKIWDITKLGQERIQYHERVHVPVLVLNGKYDPVIPPKYDQKMSTHLNNCYIYRFDGVPHSAFDNATECVLSMVLEFLDDPSKAPDSSCMDAYKQEYRIMGEN